MNDTQMELLRQAVDTIVAREQLQRPEMSAEFWEQFRDVLLKIVIERRAELLPK